MFAFGVVAEPGLRRCSGKAEGSVMAPAGSNPADSAIVRFRGVIGKRARLRTVFFNKIESSNLSETTKMVNSHVLQNNSLKELCMSANISNHHQNNKKLKKRKNKNDQRHKSVKQRKRVGHAEKKRILVKAKGGKCEQCGYNKCISALTFHHLDRSKKSFTISSSLGLPMDVLTSEAEKCILLCLNCHASIDHNKLN